jgi:adenylate cyclase
VPDDEHPDRKVSEQPQREPRTKLARGAQRADQEPRLLTVARIARGLLPGDRDLGGDPLSTAGDEASSVLARRLAALGEQRPSVARELGLGALQVWQAMAEAQGRGRGPVEVTILFTDLVDFSKWALDAGDDAVLALLREVASATEPPIEDAGGQVVKRLGDGLMAVFAAPDEAARAAQEACDGVGALEVGGYRPQLRAGLHSGRPRKIGGDYVGVDVNIAARVAEAAKGGEVLVSEAARRELDEADFRMRRKRRFRGKGTPQGLEVYAVEPETAS